MKEILTTLFRRKRAFLAFFTCMVTVPMSLSYILPATYQAKATVLLTPSRFKKPFLPDERDARTGYMQLSMEDVGSEVELITSLPVLSRVVDTCRLGADIPPEPSRFFKLGAYKTAKGLKRTLTAIGLVPEVPPRDAAINGLRRGLNVDFIRRTNIITIKWKSSSPERARDVVNAVVDAYLTHHIRVHGNAYVLDALKGELAASQERLREAQDSLTAYSNLNSISNVESQRQDLLEKLGQAQARIQLLGSISQRNLSPETLGALTEDQAVTELSKRLTDAEMRKIELGTRFASDDRKLVATAQEISELRKLMQSRIGRSLSTWKSLAAAYKIQLAGLDTHKIEIDRHQQDIDDLQRLVQLNREKTDEVLISKAMDKAALAGARVVEDAVADPMPVFPRRIPILIISIFFGVVFGAAFVVGLDGFSLRVLSVDDVEHAAKSPVLASIPLFRNGGAPGLPGPSPQFARALLPVPAGLGNGSSNGALHTILLASPSAGAGTTSLCNHLGGMLASGGATAILSFSRNGAHPDQPVLSLNTAPELPVADYLVFDEGYGVYRMALAVTPDRVSAHGNPAPAVIDALRTAGFKHLLIDAASPRGDTLYLQFVSVVEHVILVTAYEITSKPALTRMADLVRRQGGHLTGCLFNRRQDVIPEFLYSRFF